DDAIAVFNPSKPTGGLNATQIKEAKILTWKGYCHVHMFSPDDVAKARTVYPAAKIIVHPETPKNVLRLTDAHGSTSQIVKYVENAPDGATIVIGTEINLVKRLAAAHKDRLSIYPLRPSACRNMALTTEEKLLKLLEKFPRENEIHVEPQLRANAALALNRMLAIS
ncbi:MAG: quinolinate synthase NadA, partial [Kiritimatiellia bacterium]|nr:quinolinate synthase NadA [Kiritimatiellia bacterium]